MSKILEELRKTIAESSISLSDQNDLLIFLPILPENVLIVLVETFKKSPRLLKQFNENFKAKVEALIDGRDAWQKMLEKENDLLKVWQEEFDEEEKNYGFKKEIERDEESWKLKTKIKKRQGKI